LNVRLRVLVAVAATAVLGVGGAVAAAVPASAINTTICEASNQNDCLVPVATPDQFYVEVAPTPDSAFIQNCSGNGQVTYGGEPYCEIHESGYSICLEWDSNNNTVNAAACNGTIASQHWWWSGSKFRNYYASVDSGYSGGVCLHALGSGNIVLAVCSDGLTAWDW
jgi:hypothetical protein